MLKNVSGNDKIVCKILQDNNERFKQRHWWNELNHVESIMISCEINYDSNHKLNHQENYIHALESVFTKAIETSSRQQKFPSVKLTRLIALFVSMPTNASNDDKNANNIQRQREWCFSHFLIALTQLQL